LASTRTISIHSLALLKTPSVSDFGVNCDNCTGGIIRWYVVASPYATRRHHSPHLRPRLPQNLARTRAARLHGRRSIFVRALRPTCRLRHPQKARRDLPWMGQLWACFDRGPKGRYLLPTRRGSLANVSDWRLRKLGRGTSSRPSGLDGSSGRSQPSRSQRYRTMSSALPRRMIYDQGVRDLWHGRWIGYARQG
jgi:hypothetical protein